LKGNAVHTSRLSALTSQSPLSSLPVEGVVALVSLAISACVSSNEKRSKSSWRFSKAGAAGEDELRQVFGLYGQTTGKGKVARSELHGRPLELFMCSVLKRQGYGEGFRWISQYLD